jgi:hypothetical protein
MPLQERTNLHSRPVIIWSGLGVGGLAGLAMSLHAQLAPRLLGQQVLVFTGFPQGLDQYHYAAYVQALWRSPTGITYAYPFALWWEAPPVLFHLPFLLLSLIGRLSGLPLAFEIMRIAGAAATGAALAALSVRLFGRRPWAVWMAVVSAAGGAWFWPAAVFQAIKISGADGLTETWEYLPRAMGPFFSWLPFIGQNLVYPLECFYHALVIASLYFLAGGKPRAAFACNLATWLSNPFPSVALNAAVVPYLAYRLFTAQSRSARSQAGHWLLLWMVAGLAVYGYYHIFLGRWEITREAARLHIISLAEPPTLPQTVGLLGPGAAALLWSVASRAGRRHVWGKVEWSLFAMLALSQLALLQHGHLLGGRAFQPYHFNRGYLHLGLCVVLFRWLVVITRQPRSLPRWCVLLMLTLLPDQVLWLTKHITTAQTAGLADRDTLSALSAVARIPGPRIVLSDGFMTAPLIAALTHHEPFDIPESIFIPFSAERQRLWREAVTRADIQFTDLGITLAIVRRDGSLHRALSIEGWTQHTAHGSVVVLKPPDLSTP